MELFKEIFSKDNLTDIWNVLVKKRPEKARTQLKLIYLAKFITILPTFSFSEIMFPIKQKSYKWDLATYQLVKPVGGVMAALGSAISIPLLSGYFKLSEPAIIIISDSVATVGKIIFGTILSPVGIYSYLICVAIARGGPIAINSLLPSLVEKSELGKTYSVSLSFEAFGPSIGAFLFNAIFQGTIHSYPTAVFHVAVLLSFIPILCYIWIDLVCMPTMEKKRINEKQARVLAEIESKKLTGLS